MAFISDADGAQNQESASTSSRLILPSSPIPEPRSSSPDRPLDSASNAAASFSSPGRSRSNHHGGWPGAVVGGFLSWITQAGGARADHRKKKPAPPHQDAHGLPLPAAASTPAPQPGNASTAARYVVAIPVDRFRCVNVGVGSTSAPPRDAAAEDGNPGDDMTEWKRMELHRRQEREHQQRVAGGAVRPCILPEAVREDVEEMVRDHGVATARLQRKVADRVKRWYHSEGFAAAQVVGFGDPSSGEVSCAVREGDITRVEYTFVDELGNVVDGRTRIPVIERELPEQLRPGHIYNLGAAKQAERHIHSLGLFSKAELIPCPDETQEGGVILQVQLREEKPRLAGVDAQWSIVPDEGQPTLASIKPGGTISFGHSNISGLNRSLAGYVSSVNLLSPKDDLSFNFEYEHPYLDGVENFSRNRTFKTSCFNSRKLSPTFVAGPSMDAAPPIWIDRVGLKANITEKFTKQSKFTYGLVLENITALDEHNNICTHGSRILPNGTVRMDGPPTTFSGTGVDQMAFLQANITRDNTEFLNGATIGDRCIFQVDQSLGIGSKNPLFNRHQLSLTKFFNLNKQEKGPGKPPPAVLALHGRYAGCVGDLPSYDAFALGGPHSVRGYSIGELGATRNLLEVGSELRIPVTVMDKLATAYIFAEHGTDLGSSKDVKGNPTEFFQRAGSGSSYGVGVQFGPVRAEYIMDHSTGTGAFSFGVGDRF